MGNMVRNAQIPLSFLSESLWPSVWRMAAQVQLSGTTFSLDLYLFLPGENGTIKTCGIASYELFEGFIFLDHQKILKIRGATSI